MILGIDEVGRGPWAGPLVVGAVVLGGAAIDGLTDSKKLTKKRREALDTIIREQAVGYGLGWVHAEEIDDIGLSEALRLATRRAVEQVRVPYHEIIIDGTINFLEGTTKGEYVTTMTKADLLVPSVSAASIIAKVARDNYMTEQDDVYEGYRFSSHSGYGTAAHRSAIDALGVTPLHRLSFAPLAKYRHGQATDNELRGHRKDVRSLPTTKGSIAEGAVVDYLKRHGHEIVERNWKTKYCEIDIISTKEGVTYFTEVKYRRQANQGGGFGAITQKKQKQMRFAAECYLYARRLSDTDAVLAAAAVSGDDLRVEDWMTLE